MIARQTRILRCFLPVICLVFLTGGDIQDKPSIPGQSGSNRPSHGESSTTLTARIFFDATVSMKGFVKVGAAQYSRVIRLLENVVLSGWADGQVEFYRFGTHVEPIDRDSYLRVRKLEFYEDSRIKLKTHIEKVIDHETREGSDSGNEGRLAIIVTDLFQTNNDTNVLVARFKDNYLKKNLAVGILGIRSHFDGVIYDIGNNRGPRPYTGDRPFYLLAVGRHSDIAHYFETLIDASGLEARTVIFSRDLIQPLASFDEGTLDSVKNLVRVNDISPDRNVAVKQFRVRRNADKAGFSIALPYRPLPHATVFNPNRLEASVVAYYCDASETKEISDPAKYVDVSTELVGQELRITTSINPKTLSRKRVYLCEVHVRPEVNGFGIPAWCSFGEDGWDMGLEFDGSRTRNLGDLGRSLSQVTARIHRPKIGKLFFYLEKR